MRIALLGTRGIPASYSGFETCVEQLGKRLVRRGHEVTVYCRSHHIQYEGDFYEGMRLVKLPTVFNKYLDTIVHSFISSLHLLPQRYDVALYFIAGNSPVTWVPRLVGTRTVLNVDGLDWKREKWPSLAKRYIQFAEYLATKLPSAYLTDSIVVQQYYEERYGDRPPCIPYGSEVELVPAGEQLSRFNLEPDGYILFVGRLVPENCVHHLIQAFRQLETELKCVIVGDSAYAGNYKQQLRELAAEDPRIIFTGYLFGRGYHELDTNARIFVETSGVGGTHPALLEAMAHGNCVVVNDTLENLETIAEAGLAYDGMVGADSLKEVLKCLLDDRERIEVLKVAAKQHAKRVYTWQKVTDSYERLFHRICGLKLPSHL